MFIAFIVDYFKLFPFSSLISFFIASISFIFLFVSFFSFSSLSSIPYLLFSFILLTLQSGIDGGGNKQGES